LAKRKDYFFTDTAIAAAAAILFQVVILNRSDSRSGSPHLQFIFTDRNNFGSSISSAASADP
jgi:hypothetical protein